MKMISMTFESKVLIISPILISKELPPEIFFNQIFNWSQFDIENRLAPKHGVQ